ncbi:glycosyltransferase family 2 protein [Flavobacterium cupreum]|uniref:Glycosyltransferase family 2 protein n=1 Tax=Flavobacterium cupreum TaxID=2133766 RepID=A0A434A7X0_9FLAO|nr:glycosyltransferase family 2 protein [Flavobacterium cupreum]RUT70404.1 glycosyltransferase family 2 protein [Flavobacterium cupreum]
MISVCIATYNGEKYIREQLLSILFQLESDDEIIISDDHSTDETISIIKSLNDNRIKIFFNVKKGYTNNFQNAIMQASGDHIFLSDQDDVWEKNKVKIVSGFLKNHDFVVSNAKIVDENLVPTGLTFFEMRGGGKKGFWSNLIKAKYLGCCMAFNKNILPKLIPFPEKVKLCPHDLWLSLISEFYYKTYVISEPLVLYRRHNQNVSTGAAKSTSSFLFKVKFRVYSFFKVICRAKA